jgi:hypothetical protein
MLLAEYDRSGRHYFEFDPNTGAYSQIKLSAPRKNRAGFSGMGQLLRSPGEGKVPVAQYLWFGEPWLWIRNFAPNNAISNASNDDIQVT